MKVLLLFAGWWVLGSMLRAESAGNVVVAADPNGWSIRTYRMPALDVEWPPVPKSGAGDKEMETYLRLSYAMAAKCLSTQGLILLPEGSLAIYDPANQTLAVRTANTTQGFIANFVEMEIHVFPRYLSFSVHVVEAEDDLLRTVVKDASRVSPHRELWLRVQTFMEAGKAREVSLLHLDTRSGQRVEMHRGAERTASTGFTVDELGRFAVDQDKHRAGDNLELDPIIGPEGGTIDLSFSLEHHYAPPTDRWSMLGQKGARRLEAQMTDFHRARVTTAFTLLDGDTHLLGVWKPDGVTEPARANMLQAAFLTAETVLVLPPQSDHLADLLKIYGEKVVPTPKADAAPRQAQPGGMISRCYRVLPDFTVSAVAADPKPAAEAPRPTAQEILVSAGVPFPEGATASFNPFTSVLAVRNTAENLEKVRGCIDNLLMITPTEIDFTLQADAKTLRGLLEQTHQQADHTAAWKSVEDAVAQGHARILSTSWVPTRSGQRANLVAGTEYTIAPPPEFSADAPPPTALKSPAKNQPEKLTCQFTMTPLGISLEVSPVIAADQKTLDVSVSLANHYAPPTVRNNAPSADERVLRADAPTTEFHQVSLTSSFSVTSGMTRLLGVWKPEGAPELEKEDVLQAAFLKVDVVPVGR